MHRDHASRVSIVLRGALAEESGWGSVKLAPGDILLKSQEAAHENRFGSAGASILSVTFPQHPHSAFRAARLDGAWLKLRTATTEDIAFVVTEAVAARDRGAFDAALADLFASVRPCEKRSRAPRWLVRLYHELESSSLSEVDVAARALAAGHHPVTASREFRRQFGLSITNHAARQGVRRALAAMAHGELELSTVALGAGFYDQSHMNRVFKRVTGRTPGQQRARLTNG